MKLLIIATCMVRLGLESPEAVEQGRIVNVDKAQAETLTKFERALYTDKADDPTKDKHLTASAEMVAAAEKLAKKSRGVTPAGDAAAATGAGAAAGATGAA